MNASPPLRHFRRETVVSVILVLFAGCSLQDLDGLGPGNSNGDNSGVGGSSASGGNGGGAAGSGAVGAARSGGTSGSSSIQGAAGTAAGTGNTAGAGNAGGIGSIAGTANAGGGTKDSACPAFTGAGGALLTPPSNDFEVDTSGWATTALNVGAVSIGRGDGNACTGSSYLMCDGAGRTAAWDGPCIDILRLITPGRTYNVALAARFAPANAPISPQALRLVCAKECATAGVDASYLRLQEQLTDYKWVRLGGQVTASMAGCTTLSRLMCYVETEAASASLSLHLDDFRLYDATPTGAGGAAGAPSTAAGSAGTAGAPSTAAGSAGAAGAAGRTNLGSAGTAGIR